jgi:protein-S-isoprenylcysteine O-methyltransferase Ste14
MNLLERFNHSLPVCGRFFFKVRNGLFPAILVSVLLTLPPVGFLGHPGMDAWVMMAGLLVALGGQALRLAVIGYAYVKRGGKNREVYANHLVTRGFYAHTRNPMYVGNFLIVLGLGLLHGSAWVYGLVAAFFAWVYLAIVSAEETYLQQKFGAGFQHYAETVNRFLPNPKGLKASLAAFEYDWRRALLKEYNTVFFVLAVCLGLILWKLVYLHAGLEQHNQAVVTLGLLYVPLIAGYTGVRYLKKTRRLRPLRDTETEAAI